MLGILQHTHRIVDPPGLLDSNEILGWRLERVY